MNIWRAFVCACMHVHVPVSGICVHTCVHACAHSMCIHKWMCECDYGVCVCVCVCVCVWCVMCACVRACVRASILCVHVHMHVLLPLVLPCDCLSERRSFSEQINCCRTCSSGHVCTAVTCLQKATTYGSVPKRNASCVTKYFRSPQIHRHCVYHRLRHQTIEFHLSSTTNGYAIYYSAEARCL